MKLYYQFFHITTAYFNCLLSLIIIINTVSYLNNHILYAEARTYVSTSGRHCLSGPSIHMWNDGSIANYGISGMSINKCQTVCDKHSSQCVGFDYFYPTQSCLWKGGSLPDSNDGNKVGTFRKGKCSYAKDFHHALLPTGNNGTCRTIGKKVETIVSTAFLPDSTCLGTDGFVYVLYTGHICNTLGGIQWDTLSVVGHRNLQKEFTDCTWERSQNENSVWQTKWFGTCGTFSDVHTGITAFPYGPYKGFVNAYVYGLFNDPTNTPAIYGDKGSCPNPLTFEQCRAYATVNRLKFNIGDISAGDFEFNDNTKVYGCIQDRNDNQIYFNFAKEITKTMTCRSDKSSRYMCVCHVGIPSSACSVMCPWNEIEQITTTADCGSNNLIYNDGNDLEIYDMDGNHPNNENAARDICAKKCYARLGLNAYPPCTYFKNSVISGSTTDEKKCFQEFLNDACETSPVNKPANYFRSYRLVPPESCDTATVDSPVYDDSNTNNNWGTFIASQYSYVTNKTKWHNITFSSSSVRCKTLFGHKDSVSNYLEENSLRFDFFGKSYIRCEIIVPHTFSAIRGYIKVKRLDGNKHVDESGIKNKWAYEDVDYRIASRDGGPCDYNFDHIKTSVNCKLAATELEGKTWGGEIENFDNMDGCYEDNNIIYFNTGGMYKIRKVENIISGAKVCFWNGYEPSGEVGSFTFGTPGKILANNGLIGMNQPEGIFSYDGSESVPFSNMLRFEVLQNSELNDFDAIFSMQVYVPGTFTGGNETGVIPPPRHSHSLAVHTTFEDYSNNKYNGNIAYLYGGISEEDGIFGELYVLDLDTSTWSMPAIVENGQEPGPLYGHAAIIYKDSMLIYGGCCLHGEVRNDLFALNLKSMTWTRPLTEGGLSPGKRYYHTFVFWLNKAYIYGGTNIPPPTLIKADPCGRRGKTSAITKTAVLQNGHVLKAPFNVNSKFGQFQTLTYETWIKFDAATFSGDSVEIFGGSTGNHGWFLKKHANCNFGHCLYLGESNVYGRIPIELNRWYHLAVTLDQDLQLKYYVNGQIDTDISLDNTCASTEYHYVKEGLPCPGGYDQVDNAATCQLVANDLSKTWGNQIASSNYIPGCVVRVANDISQTGYPDDTGDGIIAFNSNTDSTGNRGLKVCRRKNRLIVSQEGQRCPIYFVHVRTTSSECQTIANELSITYDVSSHNLEDHVPGCIFDQVSGNILFNDGGVELTDVSTAKGRPVCTPCLKSFIPDLGDKFVRGIGAAHLYNFRLWKRAVTQAELQCNALSTSIELTAEPYGPIFWPIFSTDLKDTIANQHLLNSDDSTATNINIAPLDFQASKHETIRNIIDRYDNICLDCSIACPGGAAPPCYDNYPWRTGTKTWENMKNEAISRGGRLPTLTEARALSVDDPQLSNIWIAVQNPNLYDKKDWMQLSRNSLLYPHGSSYVELLNGYPTWGDKSDVVVTPRSKYFAFVKGTSDTIYGDDVYMLNMKKLYWHRSKTSKNIPPIEISSINSGILTIPNGADYYDQAKFAVGDNVRIASKDPYETYSCVAGTRGRHRDGVFTVLSVEKLSTKTEVKILESIAGTVDTGNLELIDIKDGKIIIPGHFGIGTRLLTATITYDVNSASGKTCSAAGTYSISDNTELATTCRVASTGLNDAKCVDTASDEATCTALIDEGGTTHCVFTKGSTCRDSSNLEVDPCTDAVTDPTTCNNAGSCTYTHWTSITLKEHIQDMDSTNNINDGCLIRLHENDGCAVSRLNMRWKSYKARQPIKSLKDNIISVDDITGYGIGDEVTLTVNSDVNLHADATCDAENGISTYKVTGVITDRQINTCRSAITGLEDATCYDSLLSNPSLVTTADALLGSITTNVNEGTEFSDANPPVTVTTSGSGTGIALDLNIVSGVVSSVTVTTAGSGYQVGDTLTIPSGNLSTSNDVIITLVENDFVSQCTDPSCIRRYTDNAVVIASTTSILDMAVDGTNARCMLSRFVPPGYMKWTKLVHEDSSGDRTPTRRSGHSTVVDSGKMIIFGGYDGKRHLNDVQILDLENNINRKWMPGITRKIQGKYLYIHSERDALLTLLKIKVFDYYGNDIAVGKTVKHGFDRCPSGFPYAYSATMNFDSCCDDNKGFGDQRKRGNNCIPGSSEACTKKPCVDFVSATDSTAYPSTDAASWISIHLNEYNKQYENPIHRISILNGLSTYPTSGNNIHHSPEMMKRLKDAVLFITDEDIEELRDPMDYSLKWTLNDDPFQEYVNDRSDGYIEKDFRPVCLHRNLGSGCVSISAKLAYGSVCHSYPTLEKAFQACLHLPPESENYCNTITYLKSSGKTCFSYCSENFGCSTKTGSAGSVWRREVELPSPRSNHTAVVQNGVMHVYGGWDGQVIFDDLWNFDVTSGRWSSIHNLELKPYPRFSHASVLINGRMITFGGHSSEGIVPSSKLQCKKAGYCSPFKAIHVTGTKSAYLLRDGSQSYAEPTFPFKFWNDIDDELKIIEKSIVLDNAYHDGWYTVFTEAVGEGYGDYRLDDSNIRLLNLDGVNSAPPEECVINGNYQVRIEYGSALSNYVQFTVPSGSNIFEQQINQNIQLSGVTSSFSEFGTTATFCHACVKDGTRFGDSCWAVTKDNDNNRQYGCNGPNWEGIGVYYGGKARILSTLGWGGGFAGDKLNNGQKGGLPSVGVVIKVKCDQIENIVEVELDDDATLYIFSDTRNSAVDFGTVPQYRYDSLDNTLYRDISTSVWKQSMDNSGNALSTPYYIRLSFHGEYIEGEYLNDATKNDFVGLFNGKKGHFKMGSGGSNTLSFEISYSSKQITIHTTPNSIVLSYYNGDFSFNALFLEKSEPSLTLKNDNLLPGASGGPYTFNVWKSRIRKRNQRRKYHLNNDWKGTFGFALMPQHSATVCDKCGTRNDVSELLLYSTEGCEVNCFGCLSHETCVVCEDRFYLKNGNCYPSDICPHGIQSFNMPGKLPDVVCVTCSNGFSHCKGLTGYGRPATYVPSFNPFEKSTNLLTGNKDVFEISKINLGSVIAYTNYHVSFDIYPYSKSIGRNEIFRFTSSDKDCCAYLDKYLCVSFVPNNENALYFDSGQTVEKINLDLQVSFGSMRDGNMIMHIPAVSSGILLNQWSKVNIHVINNVYTVAVNRYKTSLTTTRRYRRPVRNDHLNIHFGQDPEQVLKSSPFVANGPFEADVLPSKNFIFLGSTGLFSDFTLSFSIWTTANKIYSKEIIRFSDGRSKSPVIRFDINGNLDIIMSENEQNITKDFISFKSSDHNLFDSEGWKHVLIDVHHNTLKASIQDESNTNIMPEVSVTLEGSYRPYKHDGKVYIKSNFVEEDSSIGAWTKILQIDGAEYTPDTNAQDELSDTKGDRKMSDVDINTIPADNNGYNYYMFTDDKTEEELVLYVRTKEEFQDTASVFGWKGSSPTALYDFCYLDHFQSITECIWTNRFFAGFGTGLGRSCNQWQFDDSSGSKCIQTSNTNKRCFSHGVQSSCSYLSVENQLRQNVKIYKLDLRIHSNFTGKCMEFFNDGASKSYDTLEQTCNDRRQRFCTYDEICPNGRFRKPIGGEHNSVDMWLPIENDEWVQIGTGAEGWCQKLSGNTVTYSDADWATTDTNVAHKQVYACCNNIADNNPKYLYIGNQNFGLKDITYTPTSTANNGQFAYFTYNPETSVAHDNHIGYTTIYENFQLSFEIKVDTKCNNTNVGQKCPILRFMSKSADMSPLISIKENSKLLCVNVHTECYDFGNGNPHNYELCADYEFASDGWQRVNIIYDNIQKNKLILNYPNDAYFKELELLSNGITSDGNICKIPRRKKGNVYLTTPDNSDYDYFSAGFDTMPEVRKIKYASLNFNSNANLREFTYNPV